MLPIDGQSMLEIAPRFSGELAERQAAIIGAVGAVLRPVLAEYAIETRLRIAHFLAQCCHESAGFRTTEEFASGAAYEGRADLGNTQPGDGKRYKGRGPIQLTGRANYRAFTKWMRKHLADAPDFEANPELVATGRWASWSAIYYWATRELNRVADLDDVIRVTRIINGGQNGLGDRKVKLARAKIEVAKLMADASERGDRPTLHRGIYDSPDVEQLQRMLSKYARVCIDGDFGAGTETALKTAQARFGLPPTGIADAATWSALSGD